MAWVGYRFSEDTRAWNKEFAKELINGMPIKKKTVLANALYRNMYLTSFYGMNRQSVRVYKEGWYIEFEGTRSSFAAWVKDDDGTFVYGMKKPSEDKLSYLYSFDPDIWEHEFAELVRDTVG